MAAEYVNVTRDEMESLLFPQGFHKLSLDGTRELVYGKRVDKDGLTLSLRVYTGINPDGNSREVGADAMRCNIFWRKPNGDVTKVASSKRVHRVKNWRSNLQQRIDALVIEERCACGSPMVRRTSRTNKSEFYGCANFPVCRQTKQIPLDK
jgi:hypothetical protein